MGVRYGDNFANIGSVNNFTSGKFLLRYNPSSVGVEASTNDTSYAGVINMSTPYGQSIVRIVTDNSTSDLEVVHALQDQLSVRPVPRLSEPVAPAFNISMFSNPYYRATDSTPLPEAVLRLTAALAPLNPPSTPDAACVASALALAGCSNGTWTQPAGTNLTAAVASANASASALLADPASTDEVGNGWSLIAPDLIGTYGTNYVARYFVTDWGYLALSTDAALYPSTFTSAPTTLGADQALLIRFSGRPVLASTGFWSLTVYGSDGFFVPNTLGRYALGDRSNITFPDGTLVYGENEERDGEFEILVQPEDVAPPANWTGNWLPMTKGGGNLEWNCEFFRVL
jgi:hypothetical protein